MNNTELNRENVIDTPPIDGNLTLRKGGDTPAFDPTAPITKDVERENLTVYSKHGGALYLPYGEKNYEEFIKIPDLGMLTTEVPAEIAYLKHVLRKEFNEETKQMEYVIPMAKRAVISQEEYDKYATGEKVFMTINGARRTPSEIQEAVDFAMSKGFEFQDVKFFVPSHRPNVKTGVISGGNT